jgi:polyhydroxybutyrate depolymerase
MRTKFVKIIIIFFSLLSLNKNIYPDAIVVDGIERNFIIHYPAGYVNPDRIAVVIVLHGGGGKGEGMIKLTKFNDIANDYYFAVVYPDGIDKNWNDGRDITRKYVEGKEVNDVKFISSLIDTLVRKYNIDSSGIFVTGISNGGIMCFRLACELANKIAGIAAVSSSMTEFQYNNCKPARSIPVMMIFGDEDPLVPFEGGEIMGKRGKVVPVTQSVNFWKKNNGCRDDAIKDTLLDNYDDSTQAEEFIYHGNADVVYWLIKGGGHTWPGGFQYLPKIIIGRTSKEINASLEIWKFFSDKSLKK